jgi:nicotinic acid mononucleotide adenylyltransferase
MTAPADTEERFCDESGIAKIRRQISMSGNNGSKLVFLLLSGSFNPVHTQHVRTLLVTRKYLESLGWIVVGGFLAPSSDAYVQEKLGAEGLPLRLRIALCKLAIEEIDWMSVCVKGELSSKRACHEVRNELEHHCCDVLNGRRLTGVEIMGSDTLARVLSKILMESSSKAGRLRRQGRVVCCLLRPGCESEAQREHIKGLLVPSAADVGVELMLLEPTLGNLPLEPVSSSAIRDLISQGDWEELRSKGWLQPSVLEALRCL